MNYELAKQLKEAGFPQDLERRPVWVKEGDGNMLTLPTLEELIDACGENLKALMQEGINKWVVIAHQYDGPIYGSVDKIKGNTPTEAVAHLYLSLVSVQYKDNDINKEKKES